MSDRLRSRWKKWENGALPSQYREDCRFRMFHFGMCRRNLSERRRAFSPQKGHNTKKKNNVILTTGRTVDE